MKRFGFFTSILMILLLPIAGYMVMSGLSNVIREGDSENYYLLNILVIIFLLVIPYFMLKFLFHAIHIKNSSEPELNAKDLPKTQMVRKLKK